MTQREDHLDTPIGTLILRVNPSGALIAAGFATEHPRMERLLATPVVTERDPAGVSSRLAAWFAGQLDALEGLRVEPEGTEFQRAVWSALRAIPTGQTRTYGQLAAQIGRPKAVRAVGAANGANPISVVVPCHRVVGADGSLTGYAGGLERKRWLLTHEQPHLALLGSPR